MSADKEKEVASREKDIFSAIEAKSLSELKRQLDALEQQGVSELPSVDSFGATPLIAAAKKEFVPALRLLAEWCDVDAMDNFSMRALAWCVETNNLAAIKELAAVEVVLASQSWRDALWQAASLNLPDALQALIDLQPQRLNSSPGATALHAAAQNGSRECALVLIAHCDPGRQNIVGDTALVEAIDADSPEIALLLVPLSGLGKGVWSRNEPSVPALYAAAMGAPKCLAALLSTWGWEQTDGSEADIFAVCLQNREDTEEYTECLSILQAAAPLEIGRAAVARHGKEVLPLLFARIEAEDFAQTVESAAKGKGGEEGPRKINDAPGGAARMRL